MLRLQTFIFCFQVYLRPDTTFHENEILLIYSGTHWLKCGDSSAIRSTRLRGVRDLEVPEAKGEMSDIAHVLDLTC